MGAVKTIAAALDHESAVRSMLRAPAPLSAKVAWCQTTCWRAAVDDGRAGLPELPA